VKANNHMIIF